MMRLIGYVTAAMLVLGAGGAADARTNARANGLRVDRVVILMRHGVRPPTKAPPMPAGVAAEPWPTWPVAPGYLTHHGSEALRRLGAADRARFIADGLLPNAGCMPNAVRIVADSDQRTIATATVWAAAVAPGCPVDIAHRPQDQPDPLFSPIDEGAVEFDAAQARAAVLAEAGPGGIAAHERRLKPVLARLDALLCGTAKTACGLPREPSGLAPAKPDSRPKLSGALDRGSTVAQILLLEYADGKPMAEVGWGRATPADIARASELHAVEFQLLARPLYVAARNMSGIGALMRRAIGDERPDAAAVTMVSGHDTNIASFAGLLDLHWRVPGLAADDPSPGGAIVLERLVDRAGHHYVRAAYRSQTLENIRTLKPVRPTYSVMPIKGCIALRTKGLCSAAAFDALLEARLAPVLGTVGSPR